MKQFLLQLATAVVTLWSVQALAANEVSLLKAQTTFNYSRQANYAGRFDVLVAHLAYQKQVYIHLRQANGSWNDIPLTYKRSVGVNRELWSASYYGLPTDADKLVFAVKYQVNGQTYWDNNNGANYTMEKIAGTLLNGVNVYDGEERAEAASSGIFYGDVSLKNLGFAKQVDVLYSTDGWLTSKTAKASFDAGYWSGLPISNPNALGIEDWRFQLDVGAARHVDYAISYTVNGSAGWDNNFGANYRVRLLP